MTFSLPAQILCIALKMSSRCMRIAMSISAPRALSFSVSSVKESEQFSRSASMTMVKFSCKIVWLISRTFTFHLASSELTPAIIPT